MIGEKLSLWGRGTENHEPTKTGGGVSVSVDSFQNQEGGGLGVPRSLIFFPATQRSVDLSCGVRPSDRTRGSTVPPRSRTRASA